MSTHVCGASASQETVADEAARLVGCIKAHVAAIADSRAFQPWPGWVRHTSRPFDVHEVPLEVFDALTPSLKDVRAVRLDKASVEVYFMTGWLDVSGSRIPIFSQDFLPTGKHAERVKK